MNRCTLDTNIITAFLKNDLRVVKAVSDYLEAFDKLTINIISYYEILRGLKDLGSQEKLKHFEDFIQKNEIDEDLILITNNTGHFKRIKDLKMDNWLA